MLAVTFKADALFDVDSAALKAGAFDEIQRVSTVLNQYPQTKIIVSGHTDSTGSEAHNLKLSERRANSVKNALAGQGVSLARITTIGYGQATPIASNSTESGRQLNRRVVVTIKPSQG
jgi:outer membrane protein OmpA-like peptidoglycan-associated protein